MRYIYQNVVQDGRGNFVASASITVYLAGGTTKATVYAAFTGGTADADSVIAADSTGTFIFYVDESDYAHTQQFKVVISKTGYSGETWDYLQIFPTSIGGSVINEFSTDTTLAGNSDVAVPTEKAVKTYVDALSRVPAGGVSGFAMDSVPTGWLECDGAAINRTTYAILFTAIGTVHGVGNGSTTFNTPNYQGQFLRGWDNSAGVDLGAASRTDAGDGSTTGDNVGTKQASQNKAHTHTVEARTNRQADTASTNEETAQTTANDATMPTSSSGGTVGDESRPTNIAVMYCIKY